jgi:hypothetical protein
MEYKIKVCLTTCGAADLVKHGCSFWLEHMKYDKFLARLTVYQKSIRVSFEKF